MSSLRVKRVGLTLGSGWEHPEKSQHFRIRKRRPLRKQGRSLKNVYRLNEGKETVNREMENPGVIRDDW